VPVVVYERSGARTDRLQGYRVHINPDGSRALHECLAAEQWQTFVETCGNPGGAFTFVNEQLKELLVIEDDVSADTDRDPAQSHHSVSRITLHQLLSAGLDDVLHLDKEFERYERRPTAPSPAISPTARPPPSTSSSAPTVPPRGSGASTYPQHNESTPGIRAIAGKLPLTDEVKSWLPTRLQTGPNNVLPPSGCGMFMAPHDLSDSLLSTATHGIGGNDTAVARSLHFDNTASYLMWAYAANSGKYPCGDAELSALDGTGLRDLASRQIARWHPELRRTVADTPGETVSLLPIRTSIPVKQWETTNIPF
jgi:salicylate hydroxylase